MSDPVFGGDGGVGNSNVTPEIVSLTDFLKKLVVQSYVIDAGGTPITLDFDTTKSTVSINMSGNTMVLPYKKV